MGWELGALAEVQLEALAEEVQQVPQSHQKVRNF